MSRNQPHQPTYYPRYTGQFTSLLGIYEYMIKENKPHKLQFTKMHGLGNDFIIFDGRKKKIAFTKVAIAKLSDRYTGVGFDQLLIIREPKKTAHVYVEIYNANGNKVESCGNGIRCVAALMMEELGLDAVSLETMSGTTHAKHSGNENISVNMGIPKLTWSEIPLQTKNDISDVNLVIDNLPRPVAVNMGNPHIIFFVDDIDTIEITRLGPVIENHPLFPQKTNVEFAQILDHNNIRMKVWERDAGMTMACGTGACAVGVASVLRGLSNNKIKVELDGGCLFIEWQDNKEVIMTGPISVVFTGIISQSFL